MSYIEGLSIKQTSGSQKAHNMNSHQIQLDSPSNWSEDPTGYDEMRWERDLLSLAVPSSLRMACNDVDDLRDTLSEYQMHMMFDHSGRPSATRVLGSLLFRRLTRSIELMRWIALCKEHMEAFCFQEQRLRSQSHLLIRNEIALRVMMNMRMNMAFCHGRTCHCWRPSVSVSCRISPSGV